MTVAAPPKALSGKVGSVVCPGDCMQVMRGMPAASVDAVVCDPPYGLSREPDISEVLRHWLAGDDYQHRGGGFMGRSWDSFVPGPVYWREALRVLKPGGYLVAFGGTRTYDLLVIAVRLAGFEIRDQLQWLYGSGFPKGKACLKPAHEPIVLARKPALRMTPLNVDGCRIASVAPVQATAGAVGGYSGSRNGAYEKGTGAEFREGGRWPANVVLDEEAAAILDAQTGEMRDGVAVNRNRTPGTMISWMGTRASQTGDDMGYGGSGGASRFYYCAKASTAERNALDVRELPRARSGRKRAQQDAAGRWLPRVRNRHPTVKPVKLMRWLVRLVTPPGGLVLDPFAGSGTTGCAAAVEGVRFIGCEQEVGSAFVARARIAWWIEHGEDALSVAAAAREPRKRKAAATPATPATPAGGLALWDNGAG